jgi:hypothetical protein
MDTREETRNQPRPVSHEQRMQVDELRRLEYDFIDLCNRIGKSRELSLAVTNMEQAGMWAIRHIIGAD